jgi:16S rRNA (cytidine1402-2'-O)-methyltransferase
MVATPIGNLSDISPRARKALEDCDEIWCEDTRHTQQLLNALKMDFAEGKRRLRRFDQHSSVRELEYLLEQVQEKSQWIVVVTDAGTPGISDPGAMIAAQIHRFPEIRIEPIPGPSAVSAFISIAGFQDNSFKFQGFFPRESKDAAALLDSLDVGGTVFFESPKRIREAVKFLKQWCEASGITLKFCFAKELTKIHETIYSGTGISFLDELLGQDFDERGEWIFSVYLASENAKNKKTVTEWELAMKCMIEAEIPTKTASLIIASHYEIAKNLAYQYAIDLQKNKK